MKEFANVNKKLKTNEYKSFYEFQKELRTFQNYYMENGPEGTNSKLIILEFLKNSLSEGAEYFLSHLQQEADLQKELAQ